MPTTMDWYDEGIGVRICRDDIPEFAGAVESAASYQPIVMGLFDMLSCYFANP